ncbi:MAG: 2-oxoacid:ferredoxin oxidoreductase subunit beta [Clostridia bacterium]|nr:2-oxoacid:ferredoxin oxidoreductase subunit beta [Clostridia bacterium]
MFREIAQYFRQDKLPHMWCPGCGNGMILAAFARTMKELNIDQDRTVIVSGIGCSSRSSGYLDFDTLHTTHGRALAFATGVKLAKPELNVIVLSGDGDSTAIGGNHLIHAARRNLDLTLVVFNNSIYGMTGGQYSPMSPPGKKATTAPYGTLERTFNLVDIAKAAGATYVARSTAYHHRLLTKLIVNGIKHKGFSLIEAVSQCPVNYGRQNKAGTPADMLKWQKDHAITVEAAQQLGAGEMQDKFLIGELHQGEAPEYTAEYLKIIARAAGEGGGK